MVTDMRLTTNKIYRPIKKKSGVIAGIARAGGGRDSSVGYGAMDSNEEVRKPPLRVMSGLLCFLCWPKPSYFHLLTHVLCVPAVMSGSLIIRNSTKTSTTAQLVEAMASCFAAMDVLAPFI